MSLSLSPCGRGIKGEGDEIISLFNRKKIKYLTHAEKIQI
jgi:hypothetical protein